MGDDRTPVFYLDRSPGMVRLRTKSYATKHAGGGVRGKVTKFTPRSRNALLQALAQLDWGMGRYLAITLTYPAMWPTDPKEWRHHLQKFRDRWESRYGRASGLWALEYQRRGAPHWHLVLGLPPRATERGVRNFVAWTWWDVVGTLGADHYDAGTQTKLICNPRWTARYLAAYQGKRYQKTLPKGVVWAGRWWGYWTMKRRVVTVPITSKEYVLTKSWLRRAAHEQFYEVSPWAVGFAVFDQLGERGALGERFAQQLSVLRAKSGFTEASARWQARFGR